MEEWRIRQEIYHRVTTDFSDDLNKVEIVESVNPAYDALRHFREKIPDWLYPAKSYFVAICYASWIAQDFNEDFWDLLNNPMLLAGNDPYFKTYDEDPTTYDKILEWVEFPLAMEGMVPDVRKYYEEELGIRS